MCGNMREFTTDGCEDMYPGYKQIRVDLVDIDEAILKKKTPFSPLQKMKTMKTAGNVNKN